MADIYGQRIKTTVNTKYLPYVVDTTLNSNVFAQRMLRAAKKWSGRTIRVPIKVSKNITGTSFRGMEVLSVSPTDNRQFMEFDPSFYQISCVLPLDELSVADTDEAVLDLMKLTLQSDTEDMADDIGTLMYADGTGNGSKDPLGLAALVDDGSTISTIGGLSRSTFTTLASVVTASSGVLSLAKMDTLWNGVTSGNVKPTAFYGTETVFSLYGQLLRPQERIPKEFSTIKGLSGGTGFETLTYMGKPIFADEKATSGLLLALNENFIDWYGLPVFGAKAVAYKSQIKGNDYNAPVGLGFSWSDWITGQNVAGYVGHIYLGGQMITTNPRRHGKLTGITSV
jgi:hypothetical protein